MRLGVDDKADRQLLAGIIRTRSRYLVPTGSQHSETSCEDTAVTIFPPKSKIITTKWKTTKMNNTHDARCLNCAYSQDALGHGQEKKRGEERRFRNNKVKSWDKGCEIIYLFGYSLVTGTLGWKLTDE